MSSSTAQESASEEDARLLIASNRLPVQLERDEDGGWHREASSGGLVTALEPVLRREGGIWVGWPGVLADHASTEELRGALRREGTDAYRVEPVPLTERERRDFYLGFSNEILWPLCHGLPGRCSFKARYWDVYRRVNLKFADAIRRVAGPETFVWVHDYHLMAVAEKLREGGCDNPAGFFLHIPFPPPDIFEQLPWAGEVLHSLLHFDLVGFQTARDRVNFLDCVDALPDRTIRVRDEFAVETDRGVTRVGNFPIAIDHDLFHDGALSAEVGEKADTLRREIGTEKILLGVDRLDYTKGIPEKLRALEQALESYPQLRGRITLVQLVVPSREKIPEYNRMKKDIERLVGRINGRFTRGGWAPILYQFGSWEQEELLAFYRAADVALVTSIRDGMNLVSKEFAAASVDGRGVLILSAFAGSADELAGGALVVNPNDAEAVAEAIRDACEMDGTEVLRRLEHLQKRVREHDVHAWVASFMDAARDTRGDGAVLTDSDQSRDGSAAVSREPAGPSGRLRGGSDPMNVPRPHGLQTRSEPRTMGSHARRRTPRPPFHRTGGDQSDLPAVPGS